MSSGRLVATVSLKGELAEKVKSLKELGVDIGALIEVALALLLQTVPNSLNSLCSSIAPHRSVERVKQEQLPVVRVEGATEEPLAKGVEVPSKVLVEELSDW